MKLVWLDLLSYKNRCSLRFECFFRFKFILEYSRANFAIRISCTSPANTYLNMNPYLSFVQGVYLLLNQIVLWYQPEQPEHAATLWLCGLLICSNRLLPVITLLYGGRSNFRGTQPQFSGNICSEDDLRSRIFGTFVVTFLACLPLLGFSNI